MKTLSNLFTKENSSSFFGLSIVIILLVISGFALYFAEKHFIRKEKQEDLKSITKLKTDQIENWLHEREGDAKVLSQSPFFIRAIEQFQQHAGDTGLRQDILRRIAPLVENYGYSEIYILSGTDKLIGSSGMNPVPVDTVAISIARKIAKTRKVGISDFYYSAADKEIHLDFVAPVLNKDQEVIAITMLCVNPNDFLYPHIQTWPVPGRTTETLLVRRDGNEVLFLNELRFRKNTALKLRIPLTKVKVPAVRAVRGDTGFFEGEDYNGQKVLSFSENVTGTPWYVITKVGRNEIYSGLHLWAAFIFTVIILLIGLSGAVFAARYSMKQKTLLREKLDAEVALRKSQEEHKTVLYSIGDAVITTDTNGTITRMNPVAEKLTGWIEQEGKGLAVQEVFSIINEETREKVKCPVTRVLEEGTVVGLANHTLLLSKEGLEIPIADSGAPITNVSGEVTGVVLVFRDQTEERAARKRLLESEGRFRSLFEHSASGISLTDVDGTINVNKAFCDMLGYSEEELRQKTWMDISYKADIPETKEKLQWLSAGKIPQVRFKKRYIHKSGSLVWADVATFLQRDGNGVPVYFITNITDITELKKTEEEIRLLNENLENRVRERTNQWEETNKELEAFSYSVSHDLRAPLRHISGYIDLLEKHFADTLPEKAKHYFLSITSSVTEMGQLIDDLLQFSRTGRQEMHSSVFKMNSAVTEVVNALGQEFPKRTVDWIIEDLPEVNADFNLIKLVWTNLLSNALKFTRLKEYTIIEIRSFRENDEVVFCVKDNGAGFDMQYAHKLFGVFQRLHSSADFEGTGIGLANVKRIITRHGGKTWAESSIGQGASFYFSLKLKQEVKL